MLDFRMKVYNQEPEESMPQFNDNLLINILVIVYTITITACSPAANADMSLTTGNQPTLIPTKLMPETQTAQTLPPSTTPTQITTPTLTPSPTHPPFTLCSPLVNYPIANITEHISNPFNPPPAGRDEPHQGVDLAEYYGTERIAVEGGGVTAILGGQVSAVITDRFPYGNAVMIETPLNALPPKLLDEHPAQTHNADNNSGITLTCPSFDESLYIHQEISSFYILYAHLQKSPVFKIGEQIHCGQQIGAIGTTGNALNPHLHIEIRKGPANEKFESMAHYDPSATEDEMDSYCFWRISGLFQLVDPMELLMQPPESD